VAARFVNWKAAELETPATVAATAYGPPAAAFAVNVDDVALPFASVICVSAFVPLLANVPLAPDAGAAKVTLTPPSGEPFCVTAAIRGNPNAVPTCALCGDPLPTLIAVTGAAEEFVRLKFAGDAAPGTAAVTAYGPAAVEFAVNVDEVALPFASVVCVSVFVLLLENVPLAPDAGAVKVTVAPLSGEPFESTVATSGAKKAIPVCALCGVPVSGAMVIVGGATVLVKENVAGEEDPEIVAATV
jgi:hypothetical protein